MRSVHVLRNPCSEPTVAANVLRWGTGALNVDGCRVGVDTDRGARYGGRAPKGGGNIAFAGARPEPWVVLPGRWPANIVLQHLPTCEQTGTREEPGYTVNRFTDGAKPFGGGAGHPYESEHVPPSTVPAWTCAPGCPVAELDAQSGVLHCRGNINQSTSGGALGASYQLPSVKTDHHLRPGLNVPGGASRFFKQVKP